MSVLLVPIAAHTPRISNSWEDTGEPISLLCPHRSQMLLTLEVLEPPHTHPILRKRGAKIERDQGPPTRLGEDIYLQYCSAGRRGLRNDGPHRLLCFDSRFRSLEVLSLANAHWNVLIDALRHSLHRVA